MKDVGTIVTLNCPPLAKPLESYGFTRLWGKRVPETGTSSTLGQKKNRIIRASDGQLTFSPLMQEDCVYIKNYTSINCRVEAAWNFYLSAYREFACSSIIIGKFMFFCLCYIVSHIKYCLETFKSF